MDIQMPRMGGCKATHRISGLEDRVKANNTDLHNTANAFEEDQQKMLDAGLNGHIAKPVDIANLMAILKKVLK